MRIGGLASGMDVDELVDKMMKAERKPMEKMEQDQTKLTWKRDGFRDINKSLLTLKNKTFDMKLSKTFHSKSVQSSQQSAIEATGSTSAKDGNYRISVDKLASSAINVSGNALDDDFDPNEKLDASHIPDGNKITLTTYDDDGEAVDTSVDISDDDSLNDVLKKINKQVDHVNAFYDKSSQKVLFETTRTGDYHKDGKEIEYSDDAFFSDFLGMDESNEKGGTDAEFTYNGVEMHAKDNAYQVNGLDLKFKDTTNGQATLSVTNDSDRAFDAIKDYIDSYNETIEKMHDAKNEKKNRDYPPLTDEQKEEMSDKEIKQWEEKAKSGILSNETSISDGLDRMRESWYTKVDTGGKFENLTQLGITTSSDFRDGGKLIIKDEDKLREALAEDPDSVKDLFSNGDDGIIDKLDKSIKSTMNSIKRKAGSETSASLDTFSIGKEMKSLNTRIDSFKETLDRKEKHYWDQFNSMEQAIQRMNQQSDQMMQNFGGGS